MEMFTKLLTFDVVDQDGRHVKLVDLCVSLLEDDYPPVTHLVIFFEDEIAHLDWAEVSAVKQGTIEVKDLRHRSSIDHRSDVRLKRDILDALILDLADRRTTRVCDLILENDDGCLRIMSAVAGFASILYRVTRGLFGRSGPDDRFDWKHVEFLRGDPDAVDNGAGYRLRVNRLPAGEIARLADLIPYLHAAELVKLLPDDKAADVLEVMSVARQLQVIEELPENEAIELLSLMSPDLATDILGRLDLDTMKRCVSGMPAKARDRVIELLKFPENTVGGVMINNMLCLSVNIRCGRAVELIRKQLKQTDFTSLIFVTATNTDKTLRGSVSLKSLLMMEEDASIEEVMDPHIDALTPMQPALTGAHRLLDSGLAAMPVIDEEGRILGAMTVDAAISRIVASTSELQTLRIFS